MTKFQVGQTYGARSICDYNCIFSFKVVARTEKTVTLNASGRRDVRRKVSVRDGVEQCEPLGRYSMSPVLKADRAVY